MKTEDSMLHELVAETKPEKSEFLGQGIKKHCVIISERKVAHLCLSNYL